ncbi:MAG: hypothetical protein K9H49_10780 [Bacteroidales bacterium]|nr:hypothetical protein [Bacteroidales bacterium]MCF8391910.1 hypothetical protein [Bacteroidales bacterium]
MTRFLKIFSLISILFFSSLFSITGQDEPFFNNKKEITVVITDSGLGGLSVMEDVSKKMSASGIYKKVNLIFVNALFDENRGYNALSSRDEKIKFFNKVLYGIDMKFDPDIILIACNTLSVISEDTEFVKNENTRVEGIVQPGVKLIFEKLFENEKARVIITGTETTIDEGSHKAALIKNGIDEDRIIVKACPQLQSYIEQDPEGEDTEMLISFYMEEAISQLVKDDAPLYLSLNCTHFPFSEKLWQQALEAEGYNPSNIINPNKIMADVILPAEHQGKYSKTKVNLSVVSKVRIKNKDSIMAVFALSSPELSKALDNYILMPALF